MRSCRILIASHCSVTFCLQHRVHARRYEVHLSQKRPPSVCPVKTSTSANGGSLRQVATACDAWIARSRMGIWQERRERRSWKFRSASKGVIRAVTPALSLPREASAAVDPGALSCGPFQRAGVHACGLESMKHLRELLQDAVRHATSPQGPDSGATRDERASELCIGPRTVFDFRRGARALSLIWQHTDRRFSRERAVCL